MSGAELSEGARALIEATRGAYEPTAAHRVQVRWRVQSALSATARAGVGPNWPRPIMATLAAAGVFGAVGIAAALVWQAQTAVPKRTAHERPKEQSVSTTSPKQPPRIAVDAGAPVSVAPPASITTQAAKPARPSGRSRAPGDLSTETTLIATAQAATNRGQAARALALLDEYDRKFGRGALAEERAAARVFALCSAGRQATARSEAKRFLERWPRSPQAERVRQACSAGTDDP